MYNIYFYIPKAHQVQLPIYEVAVLMANPFRKLLSAPLYKIKSSITSLGKWTVLEYVVVPFR